MNRPNTLRVFPLMAAVIAALILAGCHATADERDMDTVAHDARLETQLWTIYALNRHLNPFKLDIEVRDGKATLDGEVEASVERDLAEQIALGIAGINEVDNRIEVVHDRDVRDEAGEGRAFGQRVSDATTTATVKSKLLWNRNTDGLDINVSTEDGVVTLVGTVDSDASRQLAEHLAANTEGVEQVRNQLTVAADAPRMAATRTAGEAVSDSWITSKVKTTLMFSRGVHGRDISVETRDGVVRLDGVVRSAAERTQAIDLASGIHGVTRVDDTTLRVEPN
jgi:osmotically-inducible protein OsmY